MQIIAALFIDDIDTRQVAGPSTRIDLGGVQFSAAAPTPVPLTWAPHLVVIVHNPADAKPEVRGEIDFEEYGTVEAHCRIAGGETIVVPYTLLPPEAS